MTLISTGLEGHVKSSDKREAPTEWCDLVVRVTRLVVVAMCSACARSRRHGSNWGTGLRVKSAELGGHVFGAALGGVGLAGRVRSGAAASSGRASRELRDREGQHRTENQESGHRFFQDHKITSRNGDVHGIFNYD